MQAPRFSSMCKDATQYVYEPKGTVYLILLHSRQLGVGRREPQACDHFIQGLQEQVLLLGILCLHSKTCDWHQTVHACNLLICNVAIAASKTAAVLLLPGHLCTLTTNAWLTYCCNTFRLCTVV